MSNMDFNTSILYVKTFDDGTKFMVDSCGKNSWGSTAQVNHVMVRLQILLQRVVMHKISFL